MGGGNKGTQKGVELTDTGNSKYEVKQGIEGAMEKLKVITNKKGRL